MTPCPAASIGIVRRLAALLIATAVLAACANATPSAAGPTAASLTPTVVLPTGRSFEPSAAVSPVGSAPPISLRLAPGAPCKNGGTGTACIAAGTYLLDRDLAPATITIDVPPGWFEWDPGAGTEGVLVNGGRDAPGGSGWGLLVAPVGQVSLNPCDRTKGLLQSTANMDQVVKAMTTWPGFKASTPEPITIDGFAGKLVELTYTGDPSTCSSSFLWKTPSGTEIDTYPMVGLPPSRPAQFRILDVRGRLLGIRTTDYPQPSPYEESQGVAPDPERHAADQLALREIVASIKVRP